MKLTFKKTFVKQYTKLTKKQRKQVDDALIKFQGNPTAKILRNHALKGKLKGRRAISAANDLRIVFKEEDDYVVVYLLAVGSHNQVY